jgi:hypothetical protein
VLSLVGGISLLLVRALTLKVQSFAVALRSINEVFNVSCKSYIPSVSIISKIVIFVSEMERLFVASVVSF